MYSKNDIQNIYFLTPMQEGMLFNYAMDEQSSSYLEQLVFSIEGSINEDVFRETVQSLVSQFDVLRTRFVYKNVKRPVQVVLKTDVLNVEVEDISEFNSNKREEIIESFINNDRKCQFQLTKELPFRIKIFQSTPATYRVICTFHHIILDGWSVGKILATFGEMYRARIEGRTIPIVPTRPFGEYVQWLEKRPGKHTDVQFWKEYLEGYEQQAIVPTVNVPDTQENYHLQQITFEVDRKKTDKLKQIAQQYGVTLSAAFHTIWGIFLQKYNQASDVVFGSVVSGRPTTLQGIEEMVGLFINSVPVRVACDASTSFSTLMKKVNNEIIEASDYHYSSLSSIQSQTPLNRDLLHHVIVFENYPLDNLTTSSKEKENGFRITEIQAYEETDYDFNVVVVPEDTLNIRFGYNAHVYTETEIKRMAKHFLKIVESVVDDSQIAIQDIDIHTLEDSLSMKETVKEVENTDENSVIHLFEKQVIESPDNIAVQFQEDSLTFKALHQRVLVAASALQQKGVQQHDIVAVIADPSIDMIVGMLAVLKMGASFLPIDPSFTSERIAFMVQDADVAALLTQRTCASIVSEIDCENLVLYIEDAETNNIHPQLEELELTRTDQAYIIYTSGTTGKPKGVKITHGNLVNYVSWFHKEMNITHGDRTALLSSFAFDLGYTTIFTALCYGAQLHVIEKATYTSPSSLLTYIYQHELTYLKFTPSLFSFTVNDSSYSPKMLSTLKLIVLGGEEINTNDLEKVYTDHTNITFLNHYGPTETTIGAITRKITKENFYQYKACPTIGTPIDNMQAYILDKNMHILPKGIVGEIYLAGEGVGAGYLNNQSLTNNKFVRMNVNGKQERLYRTGDLGRYLENNDIQFYGRADDQVKIRGYRVETAEVSYHLQLIDEVVEAVVIGRKGEDNISYLSAYLVMTGPLEIKTLREKLKITLPEYMIPSVFIAVDNIPLTANGKVDVRSLPTSNQEGFTEAVYEAPGNFTEDKLLEIWKNILKQNTISVLDDFFVLGGHSLHAMTLVAMVKKEFQVEISLKQFFTQPTIRELARLIIAAKGTEVAPILPAEEKEYYPASPAQKRMYTLSEYQTDLATYNIPLALMIDGEIDIDRLENAFKAVIARHESLRTSFDIKGQTIVQSIHEFVDFSLVRKERKPATVQTIFDAFIQPFTINKAPLIRAQINEIDTKKHVLLIDVHHIIADGVSLDILMNDLFDAYQGIELSPLLLQYKDYAQWSEQYNQTEAFLRQAEYWNKQFIDGVPKLDLPTDYMRQETNRAEGGNVYFTVDDEIAKKLHKVCREQGVTMYMLLMSAFQILLAKHARQEELVVGTIAAGRNHVDVNGMVGMFVNTLALKGLPHENKPFPHFLQELKQHVLEAFDYQDYPFEVLVDSLSVPRELNRNPMFDVMFVMENEGAAERKIGNLCISGCEVDYPFAKFDMLVSAQQSTNLSFRWEYRADLYKRETIQLFIDHYIQLLESITEDTNKRIADMNIMTKSEYQANDAYLKALYNVNSDLKTIHRAFEAQVAKFPNRVAVTYKDSTLTYKELNTRANQLAHYLIEQGLRKESIVAILVDRSLDMIVGILATLKAGGAYLPIDSMYPNERIQYMLEDSQPFVVLTQTHLANKLSHTSGLTVIDLSKTNCCHLNKENLSTEVDLNALAYVIYTSGSTGKSKGVKVNHRNVSRLFSATDELYHFNETDVWTMFHSYAFDFSVWEIWGALLYGGKLIVVPYDISRSPSAFYELLVKNKVTVLNQTPSAFKQLSNIDTSIPESVAMLSLRYIIFGGEALDLSSLRPWINKHGDMSPQLINMYGITETTVHVTYRLLTKEDIENKSGSIIGKPISDLKVYLLDEQQRIVPVGVPGEIYVGGGGVASGYLNRQALTETRFINNLTLDNQSILYRSGDLARYNISGELEYLGRIDHQVKIRGFRIELAEIEQNLKQHPAIQEAIVLDQADPEGNKFIAAYFVTSETNMTVSQLRNFLLKGLPDYMIPSKFVQINDIPLTTNGKVDRKKLLVLEANVSIGTAYEPPTNETEQRLVTLWCNLLNLEPSRMSISDDFFSIGGDSLKAVILAGQIKQAFEAEVNIQEIFKYSNIRQLSRYIDAAQSEAFQPIEKVKIQPYYPLSSAQQRMYTLTQYDVSQTTYQIPYVLCLNGMLDLNKLETAIHALVDRHQLLRASFVDVDGEIMMKICDQATVQMKRYHEKPSNLDHIIQSFIQPFNLNEAPLFRAGIIQLGEVEHVLMIDIHHIISDGVSMNILLHDLFELYKGTPLPAQAIQYVDYVSWQQLQYGDSLMKQHKSFWKNYFSDGVPVLNLPLDFQRPPIQDFSGDRLYFTINEQLTNKLKSLAEQTGTTMYMLLMSAYQLWIFSESGQKEFVIGTVSAGRTHPDTQQMVGMFVNTLPVLSRINHRFTFFEFLNLTKQQLLAVFQHQDYPFENIIEDLQIPLNSSRNPLFDTMFVYENIQQTDTQDTGLQIENYYWNHEVSKFDMTLAGKEIAEQIHFQWEYATKLFNRQTIELFKKRFIHLLEYIVDKAHLPINSIDLLSNQDKALIQKWNQTKTAYPKDQSLHQLFEAQVERTPHATAVISGEQVLTYKELNEKANQLAHHLMCKYSPSSTIVGLCIDKSIDMIVGMLAVLKTGAAYLPIDPSNPTDRTASILEDAKTTILLTNQHTWNNNETTRENEWNGFIEFIDELPLQETSHTHNPDVQVAAESIAYVMYTSGSTGKPKGTLTKHYNVSRVVMNTNYVTIQPDDCLLQVANYAFDGSTFDIYGALLNGASLVLATQEAVSDVEALSRVITEKKVSMMFVPTGLFHTIVDVKVELFNSLHTVLVGGDKLSKQHVLRVMETCSTTIINGYGPTESTVFATAAVANDFVHQAHDIPIGKPISNTEIYILNEHQQLNPVGVAGEIYIGGDGLAQGYLNLDKLTNETFIYHPTLNKRLYRTGDIGRWLRDGQIEYGGRKDQQVKIRGYRVEIGEIESSLLDIHGLKYAVVVTKENDNKEKYLIAYIVSEKQWQTQEIRAMLTTKVPDYMVPKYIVQLEALPLNQNGKVDRNVLPLPEEKMVDEQRNEEKPETQTEEQLVIHWKEILQVENMSVLDNFFMLGGHSLKAMVLLARIKKEWNVEVSLRDLFIHVTVRALAQHIDQLEVKKAINILPAEKQVYYPISSAQQRMYTLTKLDTEGITYNMPTKLEILGELDLPKLEKAFAQLIQRHESLRTSFHEIEGSIVQKIHDDVKFQLDKLASNEDEEQFVKPFFLHQAPLIRAAVKQMDEQSHLLFIDMHHIVSDGVSLGIFIEELLALYNGTDLPKLAIQYKDFAVWQKQRKTNNRFIAQKAYWLKQYVEPVSTVELPTDYARPAIQTYEGKNITLQLDSKLANKLKLVCKENDVTMYMLLMSVYQIWLYKHTDQEDLVIGTVTAGRQTADIEKMIGMFVQTLAIRVNVDPESKFVSYLEQAKQNILLAFENQEYPFEDLVESISAARDASRNPMFDTMFVMENLQLANVSDSSLNVSFCESNQQIAKFDLTVIAQETKESIVLKWEYASKLFKRDTVERFAQRFNQLLEEIVSNPHMEIRNYQMLNEQERDEIIVAFNQTAQPFENEKTVHEMFEIKASQVPKNIAVKYNNSVLTYKELNQKANQVARLLREKGLKKQEVVGLLVDKSPKMIIGMLAVMKAGGTYIPIDPAYPKERISYLIDDSKLNYMLTQCTYLQDIPANIHAIDLDEDAIYKNQGDNLKPINQPTDSVYMIYTSGSTGKPKGVVIEHRSVMNLSNWHQRTFELSEKDQCTQYAGFGFDASAWEIIPCLLTGATLHIISDKIKLDMNLLNDYYHENNISVSFLPTPVCEQFMEQENDSLRILLTGGDKLRKINKCRYRLFNNYGPTEHTVVTTSGEMYTDTHNVTIGKPIDNTKIFILNKHGHIQPIGVAGELCISGAGTAREYWNKVEMTKDKFVTNPYLSGEKMYRTGDVARWLPDGNIEFLGRNDNQVKIRGYRIELGEVEAVLSTHPKIDYCLVTTQQSNDNVLSLVAYYTSKQDLPRYALQSYIETSLPAYFVPQFFMRVEQFPLTAHGKIDVSALPKIAQTVTDASPSVENSVEAHIYQLWCEVLQHEKFGLDDNFFEIGGNSMMIVILHSKVVAHYSDKVRVSDLFSHPTIRRFAQFLLSKRTREDAMDELRKRKLFLPKSLIQPKKMAAKKQSNTIAFSQEMVDALERVSKMIHVEEKSILLASFLYLLCKTTKKSAFSMKCFENQQSQLIEIDVDETSDFQSLFELVNQAFRYTEFQNAMLTESDYRMNDHHQDVIPSFAYHCKGELAEETQWCDLSLEFLRTNTDIQLTYAYESNKIRKESLDMFIQKYLFIISKLMEEWSVLDG